MTESPQPYVFFSYASADRDRVLGIADRLEGAGFRVWLDRQAIAGGTSWGTEIVAAIEQAAVVVICCSSAAFASRNVRQELQLAWDAKRPYLPLLLEQVEIPRDLRYFLAGYQWVEVLDRPEDTWLPEVVRALDALGVRPELPQPSVVAAPEAAAVPSIPTNLPEPLTRCIGREGEIAEISALLQRHRLVTLTGPGGIGKTRLAIEAAWSVLSEYPDGVSFVDLAPIREGHLVPTAIASVLGVREREDRPLMTALKEHLADRRALLVLDNFEQVLDAAPVIAELLSATKRLRALATSRASLHIRGEQDHPVLPLHVPAAGTNVAPGSLESFPSTALFLERARSVRSSFTLDASNAATIAAICTRLDGLPLGIELAAARAQLLTPAQILARLDQQLALLGVRGGDRPERQQTMRTAIAWSYDLLTPTEQTLFRLLAVFVGGWSLDAVEGVCGEMLEGEAVLDLLNGLVDKSLVIVGAAQDDTPRFRMLEPIRQYAEELLDQSPDHEHLHEMHAGFFRKLSSEAARHLTGPNRGKWIRQLDPDLENFRAAVQWFESRGRLESALRLVTSIFEFFGTRGHAREMRLWCERMLAMPAARDVTEPALANIQWQLGLAAGMGGDYQSASDHSQKALSLYRAQQHLKGEANTLLVLSSVSIALGKMDQAKALLDRALVLCRAGSDPSGRGWPLRNTLECLGFFELERGDTERARSHFSEAIDLPGTVAGTHHNLEGLLYCAIDAGNQEQAREIALSLLQLTNSADIVDYFGWIALAQLAQSTGDFHRAARLWGAATSLLERRGEAGIPSHVPRYRRALAQVRASLAPEEFEAAWQAGRAMSIDEANAYAREGLGL